MHESTLEGLVADLVAVRRAGGYRFKVQERVLRQFAGHCRREGYSDGSITKEALDGFLYGRHLRASTVRRNTLAPSRKSARKAEKPTHGIEVRLSQKGMKARARKSYVAPK